MHEGHAAKLRQLAEAHGAVILSRLQGVGAGVRGAGARLL